VKEDDTAAPRLLGRRSLFASLVPPEPGGGHWIRVHRPAMACRFEVLLDSEDAPLVPAARAALDEIDAIEAALSYFRETSELSRVNREAARGPVVVSPELFALLQLCGEIHAQSGGAFDPTSTPLSRAWGFLARDGRLPEPSEIDAARAAVGWEHVALEPGARSVLFDIEGLELNLGAVGKGWALDRVTAGLRAAGASRALVSAGGSSQRAWGRSPWEVALTSAGETLARLRLRDAALGTSGAGEQNFEAAGRRYGHIIDPRTGWPSEGVRDRDHGRGRRRRRARDGVPRRRPGGRGGGLHRAAGNPGDPRARGGAGRPACRRRARRGRPGTGPSVRVEGRRAPLALAAGARAPPPR
jgi:thiamine biosynthesis lipoprotein